MISLLCVLVTCFGFYKDLCVHAQLVFMYCMHVYLYAYVTMFVCMYVCVSLDILRIAYCFHYSESQESPITQETNCTA